MSSDKMHKLVHMANQIGDNFKSMPDAEAVDGAANHLWLYWTPKMVGEILGEADSGRSGLNAIAARAVAQLKARFLAAEVTRK